MRGNEKDIVVDLTPEELEKLLSDLPVFYANQCCWWWGGDGVMSEQQMVLFRLGAEEYGISISQVKEIIQYNGATRLPQTSDFMEGIINLRGNVIPVIELAKKFGLAASGSSDRRAVIIGAEGQEIGVIVDEVTEVIRLQDTAIEPAPTMTVSNDYIRGIGKEGNRLLILLDVEKLFGTQEIEELKMVS